MVPTKSVSTFQSAEEKPAAPVPKVAFKSKLSSKKSGLLSQLEEEVAQEATQSESLSANLTQEVLDTAWEEFTTNHVQQNSVRACFRSAKAELEEEKVIITVPSQYAEGSVRAEKELMHFLRKQLGSTKLVFDFKIDLSLQPKIEKPKVAKILTDKDKYRLLREENPMIETLVKRFDLGLDSKQ